ncbi:MAG: hypothetical protein NTX33_18005 [Propionibacteriales bacterium]|nr:hypothetical protein [Propionibacteriales bacterium]
MALHHTLRELLAQVGPSVLTDAGGLRGALDDYLHEGEAAPAEITMIEGAVRHGALPRLLGLLDNHADPGGALSEAGRQLADQSGYDEMGARWAVAALGYALGRIDETLVTAAYGDYRTRQRTRDAAPPPPPPPDPTPPSPPQAAAPVTVRPPATAIQPETPATSDPDLSNRDGSGRRPRRVAAVLAALVLVGGIIAVAAMLGDGDNEGPSADRTGATDPATSQPDDRGSSPSDPTSATPSGDTTTPAETSSYVAFASRAGGTSRIKVLDVVAGTSRSVTAEGQATEPSVSADGQTVAFILATDEGKRVAISRGTEAPRLLDVGREPSDPAISPDGTTVAYVTATAGGRDVSVRSLAGTSAQVIAGGSSDEFDPTWSRDGSSIAYVLTGSAQDSIVVVDATSGEERSRTTTLGHARSPALSPAGDKVAYIAVDQGNSDVIVTSLGESDASAGANVSQSSDTEVAVVWLADGRLATSAPNRGIVSISESSATPEVLTTTVADSL